ncbi:hypothetical protein Ancab_017981 [Ancistrocladus abbreviatus]
MAGWLTPTALFVLLNIVIVVIAVISSFGTQKKHRDHQQQHGAEMPSPLVRSPSLFSRVTSFNFAHYHRSEEPAVPADYPRGPAAPSADQPPPTLNRAPSLISRFTSFNFSHFQTPVHSEQVPSSSSTNTPAVEEGNIHEGGGGGRNLEGKRAAADSVARDHHVTRINSEPKSKAVVEPAEKMRKSASEKLAEQESDIELRKTPARARVGGGMASFGNHDEEVDAKADDFINRFKQQLRLQRLESLLRYRNVNAAVQDDNRNIG